MATSELALIKKVKRIELTARKRQAIFIAEYVNTKYFDIYKEAAEQFNQLNTKHPHRPDLRKSIEFKNWQRQVKGLPGVRDYKNREITREIPYADIPLNTNDNVLKDSDIIQQCPLKVMQLEIPLLDIPKGKRHGEREINHQESEQFEQVIEEVVDQGDQGDLADVQPSIFDDLSKETIDELISQLRDDPNLETIMRDFDDDVCMNVEVGKEKGCDNEDDYDLDVDINIEDVLERELNNILG